jgi:hypothetical protein
MTEQKLSIANWQIKLERAFTGASGVLGERVQQLHILENIHKHEITARTDGFTTLIISYLDFVLQSLAEIQEQQQKLHVLSFAYHVAIAKRFRVALNEFYDGYYFDAIGTLRGVFELVMFIGAALRGCLSINDLSHFDTEEDITKMDLLKLQKRKHQHVKKIENIVKINMYGEKSALTHNEQEHVLHLLALLHGGVHRGELNVATLGLDFYQKGCIPEVAPHINLENASSFCSVALVLAWTHLRTIQYVSRPMNYSTEWKHKYMLLDVSFKYYFDNWNNPVAAAIVRLIATSYTFNEMQASNQVTINNAGQA